MSEFNIYRFCNLSSNMISGIKEKGSNKSHLMDPRRAICKKQPFQGWKTTAPTKVWNMVLKLLSNSIALWRKLCSKLEIKESAKITTSALIFTFTLFFLVFPGILFVKTKRWAKFTIVYFKWQFHNEGLPTWKLFLIKILWVLHHLQKNTSGLVNKYACIHSDFDVLNFYCLRNSAMHFKMCTRSVWCTQMYQNVLKVKCVPKVVDVLPLAAHTLCIHTVCWMLPRFPPD